MKTRYQVFVSSTYSDMVEERRALLDAIWGIHHIPIGMEMLPAANQTPWDLIQRVIDESDYYILVIRGRYGSEDASGMGFTEREYDYALSKGIPMLCFLHRAPDDLPASQVEKSPTAKRKFDRFREKVLSGPDHKHCKYWTAKDNLCLLAIQALHLIFDTDPRPGLVRGGEDKSDLFARMASSAQDEVSRLRAENSELRSILDGLSIPQANLDVTCEVSFAVTAKTTNGSRTGSINFKLSELLYCLGKLLLTPAFPSEIQGILAIAIGRRIVGTEGWEDLAPKGNDDSSREKFAFKVIVQDEEIDAIMTRLMACGMVEAVLRSRTKHLMQKIPSYRIIRTFDHIGRVQQEMTETVRAWVLSAAGKSRYLQSVFHSSSEPM